MLRYLIVSCCALLAARYNCWCNSIGLNLAALLHYQDAAILAPLVSVDHPDGCAMAKEQVAKVATTTASTALYSNDRFCAEMLPFSSCKGNGLFLSLYIL
jgi:hypothetical protein